MEVTLQHYWRSSSSWRVRWALALKGVHASFAHVNLLTEENETKAFRQKNPMGYVPALECQGRVLLESSAILEWLEETVPSPALFPGDAWDRAHVRALCQIINAGTQPLQNLGVADQASSTPEAKKRWNQHFTRNGLAAYQATCQERSGRFSFGSQVTAADLFLVPQCYNALRFEIDLAREFPLLHRIYETALATPECQASHPDRFAPKA